jgi:hypothetical protein
MSDKTDRVVRLRQEHDRVVAARYENGDRATELAGEAAGRWLEAERELTIPEFDQYLYDYRRSKGK